MRGCAETSCVGDVRPPIWIPFYEDLQRSLSLSLVVGVRGPRMADGSATTFNGRDVSAANLARIKSSYNENGVVCIQMLSADKYNALVLEQWRNVILKQKWTDEYRITVHGQDGCVLDVDTPEDQKEFVRSVVGPLPPPVRKKMEAGWPLHRGFGACCDPAVFHLEGVWSIRRDPDLYKIASHICDETRLWADVNRSIQKLPGQGDNEFLHFDFNPFASARQQESDDATPKGLCGKACYTPSRFVYVPATHSREFLEDFASKYEQYYPNVKPNDKKFGLSQDKPNTLDLVARKRCMPIPSGSLIIWHPRLLHGQMKTPIGDPVEYSNYVGFSPAGSRSRYQDVCGVDELQDRLRSYREGTAPILWPSFDKNQFYPKKYANFPHLMQAYIKKLPTAHPMLATRISPKGVTVTFLQPLPLVNYQPPPLTSLGVFMFVGLCVCACVYVCLCVHVWTRNRGTACVSVCVVQHVRVRVCVFVYVCARARTCMCENHKTAGETKRQSCG